MLDLALDFENEIKVIEAEIRKTVAVSMLTVSAVAGLVAYSVWFA